jgi:hypothetical protein
MIGSITHGFFFFNIGHPFGLKIGKSCANVMISSGFKTPSKAQWLRCRPPVNAYILHVRCAFPTCPAIARRASEGDGGSA